MIYEFENCCSLQDCNEDGELSLDEFSDLIDAFGNKLAAEKVRIWGESLALIVVFLEPLMQHVIGLDFSSKSHPVHTVISIMTLSQHTTIAFFEKILNLQRILNTYFVIYLAKAHLVFSMKSAKESLFCLSERGDIQTSWQKRGWCC